jgi:peptide/nickel transport system permease protein
MQLDLEPRSTPSVAACDASALPGAHQTSADPPAKREPALVAPACLALLGVLGLLGPLLAPYNPASPSGTPFLPPGAGHLLGTNDIGQDLLSQWLWGARASLTVAALVALLSTLLAWGVGLGAGLWSGLETPLVALTDLLLAVPALPVYLLVLVLVGPSLPSVVLVLAGLSWPEFARIVRAQVIGVRHAAYVDAARALGARPLRIAWRHVLPSTLPLLPAKLVTTVRFAVLGEATLAFLGLGDPAVSSWGTMLGWAFNDPLLFSRPTWPWWVLPPALAIALLVLLTSAVAAGHAGSSCR